MKLFTRLYDMTLSWSRHPRAPQYLGALSFAESSFFPIPPDVMLMPMTLAKPRFAMYYAALTTLMSVLGGMAGYAIGYFALEWVQPLISDGGHWAEAYTKASLWFGEWGFWAVLIAGFSPIPYKVFTISAGALSMSFIPFVLASVVGRGGRFFLVAGLLAWGGEATEARIRRYVEWIGWSLVVLVVIAWLVLRG
ncbi:FIG139438: lipoprotein B [hydrothermal vent metagenome]|uniref:FIG139438: lipoprotein B n=1 Tax=hydrothermal vent metagenome TaxID=652676 RepID=A0A3B0Y535_9ZZZZ